MHTVTLLMGTNDLSGGESRKMLRSQEKVSCIIEELRIFLDPTVLTFCTVSYDIMPNQNAMSMSERVDHINDIIRQVQKKKASCP